MIVNGALVAAVFFIHPDLYLERDRWNAPLDDKPKPGRAACSCAARRARSTGSADIWAPKYRQAAFGAFLLDKQGRAPGARPRLWRRPARLRRLPREAPGDRPIILAGHSQGALHLLRLLRDRSRASRSRSRIVAAYVVGWPISAKADLPATGLPPATADQAGCILSWQSFAEPANPPGHRRLGRHRPA
jgi:hypothetical protein